MNPAGVEMLGYQSKEEILQWSSVPDVYYHPEDRAVVREIIEKQGYVKDYEINFKRRDIRAASAQILADSTQVHQVMMNFGTNAAHAMREKGGILDISLDEVILDAETVTKYHDIKPGIPIILCSGFSAILTPEQIKALGIDDFITKPFIKRELAQVIRRVLDSKQ